MTEASIAARLGGIRRVPSRLALNAGFAVYGLALALYELWHLNRVVPDKTVMEGVRADFLRESIQGLRHGLPLLVGWTARPTGGAFTYGHRTPTGVPDDPGLYTFGGLLGWATGTTDPHIVLKWIFIGFMVVLVAATPLVFFRLFDSCVAGLLAPLLLLHSFTFLNNTETSWIAGWVTLFALPLLTIVAVKPWTRASVVALVALGVLGSFVSTWRVNTGLAIVVPAVAIALVRPSRWRTRIALVAGIVVAYVSIYPVAFQPIYHRRDRALHHPVTATFPTHHAAWHNAYIGLGYLKNPYGIWWTDEVGFHKAQAADPGVIPNSRRYVNDLRKLYFGMVRHHPGFVFRGYWAKTKVVFVNAFNQWKLALVLLPLSLAYGRRRRTFRVAALIGLPALLLTFLPPVLTVPIATYSVGFQATVGYYWLLSVVWLALFIVESVPVAARLLARETPPRIVEARRAILAQLRSRPPVFAAPILAVVGLLIALGYHPGPAAGVAVWPLPPWVKTVPGEAPLVSTRLLQAPSVATYSFANGLPANWRSVADTHVRRGDRALVVETGKPRLAYSLVGPPVALPPGSYRAVVAGEPVDGGIAVGVLDYHADRWIATALYGSERQFDGVSMVTPFTVAKRTTVQVILTNWRAFDGRSSWRLRSVKLQRTGT